VSCEQQNEANKSQDKIMPPRREKSTKILMLEGEAERKNLHFVQTVLTFPCPRKMVNVPAARYRVEKTTNGRL
jgi:hypothetical protein